jgi:ABC-type antimicrobial peptide transport system permease subunit
VRRSLGATKQRIYAIVLTESALICGFGGVYGGVIGWMVFASHSAWKWIERDIRNIAPWYTYAIPALPLAGMLLLAVALGVAGSLQGAAVAAKADPAEVLAGKDVV